MSDKKRTSLAPLCPPSLPSYTLIPPCPVRRSPALPFVYQFAAGAIAGVTELLCLYPLGKYPSVPFLVASTLLCRDSLIDSPLPSSAAVVFLFSCRCCKSLSPPLGQNSILVADTLASVRSKLVCNCKLVNLLPERNITMEWSIVSARLSPEKGQSRLLQPHLLLRHHILVSNNEA